MKSKIFAALIIVVLSTGCSEVKIAAPAPNVIENYEGVISRKDVRVLVVFGAGWCGHCRELERDLKDMDLGDLVIFKVDVDERPDLKTKHNVSSFPTSVIFLNGQEIFRKVGYERNGYSEWIEKSRRTTWKDSGK